MVLEVARHPQQANEELREHLVVDLAEGDPVGVRKGGRKGRVNIGHARDDVLVVHGLPAARAASGPWEAAAFLEGGGGEKGGQKHERVYLANDSRIFSVPSWRRHFPMNLWDLSRDPIDGELEPRSVRKGCPYARRRVVRKRRVRRNQSIVIRTADRSAAPSRIVKIWYEVAQLAPNTEEIAAPFLTVLLRWNQRASADIMVALVIFAHSQGALRQHVVHQVFVQTTLEAAGVNSTDVIRVLKELKIFVVVMDHVVLLRIVLQQPSRMVSAAPMEHYLNVHSKDVKRFVLREVLFVINTREAIVARS